MLPEHDPRWGRPRSERPVLIGFGAAIVSGLALAVVYWTGGQPQLEGIFLAIALGGIGVGIVVWAQRFMPNKEEVEERPRMASTPEEVTRFTSSFEEGEGNLQRRSLLVRLGLGAFASLGLAALFPIRSLGPRPGEGLKRTPFAEGGLRLVTEDGEPVRPDDLPVGGLLTVFPEGAIRDAQSPTLLIRATTDDASFNHRLGREEGWTLGGLVAYSKLCTHTGCPVGLYQVPENLLLCPCHQSTFDVLDGAEPVFGPAARPLPQLPLALDDEGFVIARGDFSDPVGGGFWDRGRRAEEMP
jgi:ubiquinol-cytochrome c reductase iron-sulfur subunit